MSDAELRELERAARAGDLAASRSLARALERLGEPRKSFLELCRLARLGDREARVAVGPPARRQAGLRGPAVLVDAPIAGTPLDADRLLVSRGHWPLEVSLVAAGDVAWTVRAPGNAAFAAGTIVFADARLARFSAETGELLDETLLDPSVHGRHVLGIGDRVVLATYGGWTRIFQGVEVVDVGESVRSLWKSPDKQDLVRVCATLDVVLLGEFTRNEVIAHDLETGEVRWRTRVGWFAPKASLLDADDEGVLIATEGFRSSLRILEPRTGRVLWEKRLALGTTRPVLVEGAVVVSLEEGLTCFDRTGRVRWERPDLDGRGLHATKDTLYALLEERVVGIDLRSGETVLDVRVADVEWLQASPDELALVIDSKPEPYVLRIVRTAASP